MGWKLKCRLLKPFLFIYVVCCYAIFLAVSTVYQDRVTNKEEFVKIDQNRAVSLRRSSLMDDFNVPFADARIIAEILAYRLPEVLSDKNDVLRGLYAFADNKRGYGQVRFLDADGYERIRINRERGNVRVVPKDELQSKAHRDYFSKSQRLGAGEVYVSPLDLNIENQKIEVPYVPVIRFTSPVVPDDGIRKGLVVLNFYAAEMLENFRDIASDSLSNAMLLNDKGYWLVSDDRASCWAFMFEKDMPGDMAMSHPKTFALQYPAIWNLAQEGTSGQVQNENGMFTWTTVNPAFAVSPKIGRGQRAYPPIAVSPYQWIVMQHVSTEKLNVLRKPIYDACLWAWILISLATGIILWFTMFSIQRSQEHREELEVLAHHDWLTGLFNLPHMFNKIEEACDKAAANNVPFHVMYIDLDDFKFVNDRYGHESGNIVLRHVASLLRKNVRMTDTVARIGGDEYVILLENLSDATKAENIAENILQSFEVPVVLECGSKIYVKASIGIAGWSRDITGPDDLMKRADVAMYDSKNDGKNRISSYTEERKIADDQREMAV